MLCNKIVMSLLRWFLYMHFRPLEILRVDVYVPQMSLYYSHVALCDCVSVFINVIVMYNLSKCYVSHWGEFWRSLDNYVFPHTSSCRVLGP